MVFTGLKRKVFVGGSVVFIVVLVISHRLTQDEKRIHLDSNFNINDWRTSITYNRASLLETSSVKGPKMETTIPPIGQNFTKNMLIRQKKRKIVLQESCLKLGLKKEMPLTREGILSLKKLKLLYSDKHKLLICEIPKCGCSSVKKVLLTVEGYVNESDPQKVQSALAHELGDKKLVLKHVTDVQSFERKIKTYKKLIIVRDPLYRLLSAYRNKLENISPFSDVFNTISFKIHSKFKKGEKKMASFEEFLKYLTLQKSEEFENHWALYQRLCLPCTVKYDYIAHIETIDDDMNYVMGDVGMKNVTFPHNYESSKQTNSEKAKTYYGNITDQLIQKIYKIYKTDFDLFGFPPPSFDLKPKEAGNES